MSGTRGSSGLGSHNRLHIDSNTVGGGRRREEGESLSKEKHQVTQYNHGQGNGMKRKRGTCTCREVGQSYKQNEMSTGKIHPHIFLLLTFRDG